MALANSRLPNFVAGDINAEVVGVRTGAAAFVRLVERYGLERFSQSVERMFDHGEAVVRSYFEQIPDGRYVGYGEMDNDGISDDPIPFEVVLEVEGSNCRLDFSSAPDARPGPVNCPVASTVSARRVVMTMLAGGRRGAERGPLPAARGRRAPGSMFHCLLALAVLPLRLAGDAGDGGRLNAVSKAMPDRVVACSGGDLCALVWWGVREETGELWADGSPHPVGQGASAHGDGGSSLLHMIEAATRFSPSEVWEARNPWLMERFELAPGLGRPREVPRRARAGHVLPLPRGRGLHVDGRADEERALGARRRASRASERAACSSSPTARGSHWPRRPT